MLCMLRDISTGGAKLSGGLVHELPDRFLLMLSRDHKVTRWCEVVRRAENEIGVRFTAAGAVAPLAEGHDDDAKT